MNNTTQSGKKFKKFSIILGFVLIAVLSLCIYFFIESQNAKASLEQSIASGRDAQFKIDSLEARSRADELFIQGKREEALEAYSEIPNIEQSTLLQQRQALRENLEDLERSSNIRLAKLQEQNDLSKTSSAINAVQFKNRLDSFQDSLQEEFDIEIAALQEKLDEAKKTSAQAPQLNRLVFKNHKGTEVNYFGEVKNSKANGEGVGIHSTGSVYNGQWKDNAKHGEGIYTWMEGEIYEGEFVEDKREGEGTYHWSNGNKYVGSWRDDKRNGYGKLFDKDNNILLEGDWEDGELTNKAATVNNLTN